MKTAFLFILFAVLGSSCFSQVEFDKGWLVFDNGTRKECYIRNPDWNYNPGKFDYRDDSCVKIRQGGLTEISEFGIYGNSKYVRVLVDMDRSMNEISHISRNENPVFSKELIFLRVLLEGEFSLYQYRDRNLVRFFYRSGAGPVQQLVYKQYLDKEGLLRENNAFRRQLFEALSGDNNALNDFIHLGYSSDELYPLFVKANEGKGSEFESYKDKLSKTRMNIAINSSLNFHTLSLTGFEENVFSVYSPGLSSGLGLDVEIILPFRRNSLAILLAPEVWYFNAQKDIESNSITGGIVNVSVDYTSIDIPAGIRFYPIRKEKLGLFIEARYLFNLDLASSIDLFRDDETTYYNLEIEPGNNIGFGAGLSLNRLNFGLSYKTNRPLLKSYANLDSNFRTLSLFFSYRIFSKNI